ncbi:MAG: 2-succinyl-5-enolpyruvyl-6-hydroxy-3-cyclohexene-1-carboxylic-acid synthase [Candidatus Hydrogenedens sp.]|nr:2-succinyl-5-enolpyruvyl-6-hydroxy-3-cyclohexene-1-carboxylic-acid synthase [Candidatus Hydrogenedentota bacterium]NLF56934.1 2-succinyl-5-enolpyruvyl-6-hydroxy-3-cyclohexene-1-carboxylic-acid synthase [Candidatus Hydrogenedens sp.]
MMEPDTGLENLRAAARVVAELAAGGTGLFCVCPGSRSAPLAVAAARQPGVEVVVHPDERGAAFHALGWAKASGRPAAVLCTSGTAAANFLPAAVEASMARVPLVLLTADRPPELLDRGANQAIRQENLFSGHARAAVTLACPGGGAPPDAMAGLVDYALHQARRNPAGPVHLNCMFREPLLPAPEEVDSLGAPENTPRTVWHLPEEMPDEATEAWLLNRLAAVKRGLLVAGELRGAAQTAAVAELAKTLGWPVCADITSGLRLGTDGAPVLAHYDQMLLSPAFRGAFTPDFVLHLGGAFTSKRLLEHLSGVQAEYVLVAGHSMNYDPGLAVRRRIGADLPAFCRWLTPSVRTLPESSWAAGLCALDGDTAGLIAERSEGAVLSEIGAARAVSQLVPADGLLFLGNSMPVRDMDMYGAARRGAGPRVLANRGASGIDGCLATALGAARATGAPTAAVLGDLSLLHDLNSLVLGRGLKTPFVLVAVNNDGGGIFSFLPAAVHDSYFEPLFGAPHGLRFKEAARMFGWSYAAPADRAGLEAILAEGLRQKGAMLVEVVTDRRRNTEEHRTLQAKIAEKVDGAVAAD